MQIDADRAWKLDFNLVFRYFWQKRPSFSVALFSNNRWGTILERTLTEIRFILGLRAPKSKLVLDEICLSLGQESISARNRHVYEAEQKVAGLLSAIPVSTRDQKIWKNSPELFLNTWAPTMKDLQYSSRVLASRKSSWVLIVSRPADEWGIINYGEAGVRLLIEMHLHHKIWICMNQRF